MHVTHIVEDPETMVGLCGEVQEPPPLAASTAQCSACYIISATKREDTDG